MSASSPSPLGRVAILGSGSVGGYYGGRLALAGNDVHFLLRSDYEAVKSQGLHVESPLGDFHLPQVNAHRRPEDIGPCDLVIIALKTTSNAALDALLPPLLHPNTALLTLQNGLGAEAYLADRHGAERVLGGLCFVCINRVGPGRIRHIAQGRINLGEYGRPPQPRTEAIAAEFRRCGIDCVVEPSLAAARWKKLVWNIPFNGLSIARGNKDTAAILADPALEGEVRGLMTEIIGTATALGHSIPPGLMNDMIERTRTMTRYKPSSLIDFEAGQEVELDSIWGAPLREAAAAGLAMPRVNALHQQLQECLAARASVSS